MMGIKQLGKPRNELDRLKQELDNIDMKSVRPLRAIQAGEHTDHDIERLAELEADAEAIRQQIAELGK